ncbi:aspartate aminotransferase family protein [Cellulomonas soli]|uniref:Aspartate aminotransferase family protein n=1 Tax=Cellulomonas soli TaxID=931535 RepID=A0A512P894_9CELL|nr:aspartate aminotransferase family protein [Cellulomonas soli]NYI57651.1 4-aminobutyrate aminotransferase-like enzyme [Cellulomonas soli]GEP67429.1 aspartate aminotransferase family protein [Cellulomonas soli]
MATRSTIMDTNSFRSDAGGELPWPTAQLVRRRERVLGPSYRLFYRRPVHLVRGEGAHLYDADGLQYLDVYNNVASVGHCHPRVVAAIAEQAAALNTHTRYLHDRVVQYSEDLLATMPDEIDQVMFMCTGSEANDLAVRVAQAATGGTGVIVSAEAYHGNSALTSQMSPALGTAQRLGLEVRTVPVPDPLRTGTDDPGAWFAARMAEAVADLERHGVKVAAFVADSIFSSDGVFPDPVGYLAPAVDVVRRAGGVFVADEVQPGFGRTGSEFWGFARHGVVPDLVTTGKPMGNGIPVSAMAARSDVLAAFGEQIPYFNTFGGNPVSIAAAQAVLAVIAEERLQERAARTGARFLDELRTLTADHPLIGDVRGVGLYIGVDVVTDRVSMAPSTQVALDLVEALRDRRVLTSVCGAGGNVLKLRPPLVFSDDDVDWFCAAFADALDDVLVPDRP